MHKEQREFFRFDVSLPVYFEPMGSSGACLQVDKTQLIEPREAERLDAANSQLESLFEDEVHLQNGGVQLFDEFNQKLAFMAWLVESIVEGKNPTAHPEFQQKKHEQAQYKRPEGKGSSKMIPLLQAFYLSIDNAILECVEVVDKSISGQVFMFHMPIGSLFSSQDYIANLEVIAKQGNWLASVIEKLIFKFNYYETLLNKLKRAYQNLSEYEKWPVERINLAAGGFSLMMKEDYQVGETLCALFLMDEQFVFSQAECVFVENNRTGNTPVRDGKRTAFKFTCIAAEDEAHIVRYLMSKELELRSLE
ncbi:PilZ domain-containing protein [Thiomicrorhabdus arctica]|uniref:PilZ domain-containing protein n=1 Tax=Thiomicrorhabdus arctica TaxID=131540 RepID=UPI00037E4238|nr:PilZ domain-containing protein [Thiomicrorhabdus arctica]